MDSANTEMIISCITPDVLVVEHGPKTPELLFLGIEFHGYSGMEKYLEALSQSLKIHKFEYIETSASNANDVDVVYVKGAGEFEYKETGKKWEEMFVSQFEIVKGKIVRYDVMNHVCRHGYLEYFPLYSIEQYLHLFQKSPITPNPLFYLLNL
ncbi:hypothetical protein BDN71DRAFT_1429267 [Pleurotus eryngii]|uniref:Uncharacterized protein n=1 Tax=Pleurotus eryngii TaxID=5323 RepID=A0A9P6A0V1_PLEER|nr:hypothetical protein BDN71DRAFT_1429267 [Pleurotus eryngii]